MERATGLKGSSHGAEAAAGPAARSQSEAENGLRCSRYANHGRQTALVTVTITAVVVEEGDSPGAATAEHRGGYRPGRWGP
jgi:hypothetical protein